MRAFLILFFLLSLTTPAAAGQLEDGFAAYERGDYESAIRLWRALQAEQGHASAQYNLGFMYNHGKGVPQDYAEAMKWYRLAAEQGDADAQYIVGVMYHNGEGVPQDYIVAHMWWNLAANQGNELARQNREKLAANMTPAQIAEAQRLAREWKPTK